MHGTECSITQAMQQPGKVCVIFNPAAGKLRAGKRLQQLRQSLGEAAEFRPTCRPGHATDLAREAALEGFEIVVAAGGDGTVHEVANGLLLAGAAHTKFAVLPLGSANDYAYSLEHDLGPSNNGEARLVDVGFVRDERGREKFFLCCLGLGFSGMVTLESRRIRGLQGIALYGLATLRALWYHHACPLMRIQFDDGPMEETRTLMLSALVGRREGGFVMAPNARLDDGLFDYAHAGDLSRWQVMRLLPRLAIAGPPKDDPNVRLGQCRKLKVQSESPLAVHVDGEFLCVPDDGVRKLEIELRPRSLQVLPGFGEPRAVRPRVEFSSPAVEPGA